MPCVCSINLAFHYVRRQPSVVACLVVVMTLCHCFEAQAGDSALADAVEKEAFQSANEMLEKAVDANGRQVDGMTALHWATVHEHAGMVDCLLRHGADASATNRYQISPLHIACQSGNAKIVQSLMAAGADANAAQLGGETPLMTAARTGKLKPVQLLIEQGADVNLKERRKQTALMWAAADGHAPVVQELIEAGAEFRKPLDSGFSPLMFAVRGGHTAVVRVLLEAGANVNEQMNPERTGGWHPRKAMSPLHLAIENGHYELGLELLKQGANANDQRCGFTPLHNLTWVRKPPRGDNVEGAPPPIGSGNMTSLQFIRVLVEHGADVNAQLKKGKSGRGKMNHKGATPFLFAARRDDVSMMKLLLELGADPHIANDDNCTALLVAAGIGTHAPGEEAGTETEALQAVQLLLDLGANINHVDDNGETAMHGAAYKSLPKMIQYLGEQGADIHIWNVKNEYGWTPTLIAEGHRPGNFKPAAKTLAAVYEQLRANGIEPPQLTPRQRRLGYGQ